ncbi:NifU family protein [Persephonella sp.]
MSQEQKEKVTIDREKVEEVLEQIRPMLRFDGGDVELVDIGEDGTVYVRLMGSCHGCAMSLVTLKGGIEMKLKEAIPEVKEVVAVNLEQPGFGF